MMMKEYQLSHPRAKRIDVEEKKKWYVGFFL
jgi:hypothetical protein